MKKLTWTYLLMLTLFAITACNAQQKSPDYEHALLVDVRTPEEYASGSVTGAVNIPVDQIENRISELSPDKQIVLFCRSGNRSGRAEAILRSHGYENVINGGSWQQVNAAMNQKNK